MGLRTGVDNKGCKSSIRFKGGGTNTWEPFVRAFFIYLVKQRENTQKVEWPFAALSTLNPLFSSSPRALL